MFTIRGILLNGVKKTLTIHKSALILTSINDGYMCYIPSIFICYVATLVLVKVIHSNDLDRHILDHYYKVLCNDGYSPSFKYAAV